MTLNNRSSATAWQSMGVRDGTLAQAGHSIMAVELDRERERAYWHGVTEGAERFGNGGTAWAARRHLAELDAHHGML